MLISNYWHCVLSIRELKIFICVKSSSLTIRHLMSSFSIRSSKEKKTQFVSNPLNTLNKNKAHIIRKICRIFTPHVNLFINYMPLCRFCYVYKAAKLWNKTDHCNDNYKNKEKYDDERGYIFFKTSFWTHVNIEIKHGVAITSLTF